MSLPSPRRVGLGPHQGEEGGPAGCPPGAKTQAAVVVFGLLWVAFACWAIATPLFGSPDEPTHVVRASSVARGQIIGKLTADATTEVRAPAIYQSMESRIHCWTFESERTAACMGSFEGSQRVVPTATYVGRYNPVYYGVVGLPSLIWTDGVGVYLMRLLSAAVAAALATLAVLACLRAPRPTLALTGLAFALTPMAMFLAGTVNPNGMEIMAAICVWTTGLLVFDASRRSNHLVVWMVVAACLLVLSRGLSPLWLALILGLQALAVLREPVRNLLRDRRMVVAAVVIGVTTLAAGLWTVLTDALAVLPVGAKVRGPFLNLAASVLSQTRLFTEELVGNLQWFDTRLPFATYLIWFVGVGSLVLLAMAVAGWRSRLAIGICLGLTLLSPLLQLPSIGTAGVIWQARYSLPLAVGIPILSAYALSFAGEQVTALLRRLATFLVFGFGIAVVGAFVWAARRNAVGSEGPLFFFGREEWHPPLPGWLLLLVFTVTVAALLTLFVRLARRQGPSGLTERETQGPSGLTERETQGPSGPTERATEGL